MEPDPAGAGGGGGEDNSVGEDAATHKRPAKENVGKEGRLEEETVDVSSKKSKKKSKRDSTNVASPPKPEQGKQTGHQKKARIRTGVDHSIRRKKSHVIGCRKGVTDVENSTTSKDDNLFKESDDDSDAPIGTQEDISLADQSPLKNPDKPPETPKASKVKSHIYSRSYPESLLWKVRN